MTIADMEQHSLFETHIHLPQLGFHRELKVPVDRHSQSKLFLQQFMTDRVSDFVMRSF
jgi:hypothetical protein